MISICTQFYENDYKSVGDTVSLLKQAIEKDGTIVEDFIYYSSDLKS